MSHVNICGWQTVDGFCVCVRKEWRDTPTQPTRNRQEHDVHYYVGGIFLEIQHSFGIRQCLKGEGHFTIAKIDSHG